MIRIKSKNPAQLKESKKKKNIVGKVALGLASVIGIATLSSIVKAQLKYYDARKLSKESGVPASIAELSGDEKKEQVAKYFAEAIASNEEISEDLKDTIVSSFDEYVLSEWGDFFDEETICNMYAVASTEKVRMMDDFSLEHSWWSGDYSSSFNKYVVDYIDSHDVISHEQLHGITKGDFYTIGLSRTIGIGVNEGATAWINNDNSYQVLTNYTQRIGSMIGYDKLVNLYLHHDQKGLIKEAGNYVPEKQMKKMVMLMDKYTYLSYADTFFWKNNIDLSEKMNEAIQQCQTDINECWNNMKDVAVENGLEIDLTKLLNGYAMLDENFRDTYR